MSKESTGLFDIIQASLYDPETAEWYIGWLRPTVIDGWPAISVDSYKSPIERIIFEGVMKVRDGGFLLSKDPDYKTEIMQVETFFTDDGLKLHSSQSEVQFS